ncbi:hypothetical protein Tco_0782144, partial [Tanacetum coccineum]
MIDTSPTSSISFSL